MNCCISPRPGSGLRNPETQLGLRSNSTVFYKLEHLYSAIVFLKMMMQYVIVYLPTNYSSPFYIMTQAFEIFALATPARRRLHVGANSFDRVMPMI